MRPVTLLFHRSSRRLRTAWLDGLLAPSEDARPSRLLVSCGSSVDCDALRHLLVRGRERDALFLPEILPYDALLSGLCARCGDPRALLEPTAQALLAEDLLRGDPRRWPWLAALLEEAPIGAELAALFSGVEMARVPSLQGMGARRGAELDDFLRAFREAVRGHASAHDPAGRLAWLSRWLSEGSPGVLRLLGRFDLVLLHALEESLPLGLDVLLSLLRAFSRADVPVVLTLPCGLASDPWETDAFFGGETRLPMGGLAAERCRALEPTRRLRKMLFETLLASGEARALVAVHDDNDDRDSLLAVEPEREPPYEPLDLVDRANLGLAVPRASLDDELATLSLWRCPDEREEIVAILRDIKRNLASGVAPEDTLLALADLEERSALLEILARDHGLPLRRVGGLPLASSSAGSLTLALLDLIECEPSIQDLLAFLESDLVAWPPPLRPRRLAAFARAAGATGSSPASWSAPMAALLRRRAVERRLSELEAAKEQERLEAELEGLTTFTMRLQPLREEQDVPAFCRGMLALLESLGVPSRLGRVDKREDFDASSGTASRSQGAGITSCAEGLLGWGVMCGVVEDLGRAVSRLPMRPRPVRELVRLLRDAVLSARLPSRFAPGVRVVDLGSLPTILPPRVWVGGLSQGCFPAPEPGSFLVEGRVMGALRGRDSTRSARAALARLLREREDPEFHLVLSWPATRGGSTSPPSPVLEEFLSLPFDVDGDPRCVSGLAIAPVSLLQDPLATSDLARLCALDPRWLEAQLEPHRTRWGGVIALVGAREGPFGPHDGMLRAPPPVASSISVTTLERYLRCPISVFFGDVLALSEDESFDPGLPSYRRGLLLHRVLEAFLQSREARPLEGLTGDALRAAEAQLLAVLQGAAEEEARTGNAHPRLLRHEIARWASGLADEAPTGLLKAWLHAEAARCWGAHPAAIEFRFSDAMLGRPALTGKVDRVDRFVDGSILVIDYKTGSAPSARRLRRGLALQPVFYAEALLGRLARGRSCAAVYQEISGPEPSWAGWYGDPERVKACAPTVRSFVTREEGTAILAHATEGLRRYQLGRFHPTLAERDEVGCAWCAFSRVCRYDEARALSLRESEGDWQRPLGDDAQENP